MDWTSSQRNFIIYIGKKVFVWILLDLLAELFDFNPLVNYFQKLLLSSKRSAKDLTQVCE